MAESKKSPEDRVQKQFDEAHAQGFFGTKADPRPNSDYSLESGPESPTAAEQLADAAEALATDLRASAGSAKS